MRLRLTLGAIVLVLTCGTVVRGAVGASQDGASENLTELARLRGIWIAVAETQGGEPAPADEVAGRVLVIDKGMYALVRDKTLLARGYLKVDTNASPKTLDTVMTDGDRFQMPVHWIYQLDGNTLRLCGSGVPGQPRPANFASPSGSPFFTTEYRRQKP